jgi:hypothetical protein
MERAYTLVPFASIAQSAAGKEYNWEGRGAAWEYLIMAANEGKKDL